LAFCGSLHYNQQSFSLVFLFLFTVSLNTFGNNMYEKFEDWFYERENFSDRSDRFAEELQTMDYPRAVEWLKACWQCARNEHNDRQ
jgi:hypothetical protein